MIATWKHWMAATLAVGAGAVWVARLVRTSSAPIVVADVPADMGGVIVSALATSSSPSNAIPASPDELGLDLARALSSIEAHEPRGIAPDLEALSQAWNTTAALDASGDVDHHGEQTSVRDTDDEDSRATPGDAVANFVATHPLNGVLIGQRERCANLAGLLVHEGDALLGDLLHVRSIEPRCVVLDHGGRSVRIELAPMKARARVTTSSASGSTTAGATSPSPLEASVQGNVPPPAVSAPAKAASASAAEKP